MELSARKKQILKSVVDSYIQTGEPVGSKYLTEKSDLSVSSATVRNEMNELERMGYLAQPHASSGRQRATAPMSTALWSSTCLLSRSSRC